MNRREFILGSIAALVSALVPKSTVDKEPDIIAYSEEHTLTVGVGRKSVLIPENHNQSIEVDANQDYAAIEENNTFLIGEGIEQSQHSRLITFIDASDEIISDDISFKVELDNGYDWFDATDYVCRFPYPEYNSPIYGEPISQVGKVLDDFIQPIGIINTNAWNEELEQYDDWTLETERLAKVAQSFSNMDESAKDTSQVLDDFVKAAVRSNEFMMAEWERACDFLENYDSETHKAMIQYAVAVGKTPEQLTYQEKQQAWLNYVIEKYESET